jgi:predicted nucleic acid-binding protein
VTTAVDSSLLLDVLVGHPEFGPASLRALQAAERAGALLACPVVWSEVRGQFAGRGAMLAAMDNARIQFDPFDEACADSAGALWARYRQAGGTRTRLLPDFLVGAHAQLRGGRLLTRDRGFYRRYFPGLQILS